MRDWEVGVWVLILSPRVTRGYPDLLVSVSGLSSPASPGYWECRRTNCGGGHRAQPQAPFTPAVIRPHTVLASASLLGLGGRCLGLTAQLR